MDPIKQAEIDDIKGARVDRVSSEDEPEDIPGSAWATGYPPEEPFSPSLDCGLSVLSVDVEEIVSDDGLRSSTLGGPGTTVTVLSSTYRKVKPVPIKS